MTGADPYLGTACAKPAPDADGQTGAGLLPRPAGVTSIPDKAALIAVVDDDDDVRAAIEGLLGSLGYSALLFSSADSLLAFPQIDGLHCIISDIQMPGTSGLQLARELQDGRVPVILITAYPTADVLEQARDAQVRHLLVKPFDSADLIDCLEDVLRV